ncbi:unsaturated chondroitin disaccharide hydrolase [Cetobacterium ceti]|uniref:Unsaturated chondroitin disaccharide hydrolase n=1 Tax=Cetobacterium ceti TaxID=180163 RepID=A0A1T4MT45_9FUSO|nr:glycoside hydrolase family 88 protein [Cetobacterium ceti]SJZ70172.1 unsaturated chondroitin disaccharide hydrolase [Cetobacterium ceti]
MELLKSTIEKFTEIEKLSQEELFGALHEALSKIDKNSKTFIDTYPRAASVNNIYPGTKNGEDWDDWTVGFWTGMLWLSYEVTKKSQYRKIAEYQMRAYKYRMENKIHVNHHDLGFLYSLSAVAQQRITGSEVAKEVGIAAAEHLMGRFKEKGEFIQAWGDLNDPTAYRLIIDCNMNVPLLFWASEVTGDNKYKEIATKHINTAASVVVREDSSTHHTYYFDPETGKPLRGVTAQGFSDDSAWARGQAWGVYGFPLAYSYTKDPKFITLYKRVTNYFLNKLPEDNVCYWDLVFGDGSGEYRDTSAAAIAVCGILEMDKYLDDSDPDKKIYRNAAMAIMKSLIEKYTTKDLEYSNGLLTQAVYSIPHNSGVNECNIWGDYYFLEALVRIMKPDWKKYW